MTVRGRIAVERIVAGQWDENCYLVSSGEDAVVVDPGGRAEAILERIEEGGLRVHAVLATHGHYDHIGAAAAVADRCEAPFGIHSGERRALERVNLSRRIFHGLGPVEIPPVGIDLAEEPTLRFGDLEVAAVHTPGHSRGSVCFAIGTALLTGDTLLASGLGPVDARDADPAALRDSVERLADCYPSNAVVNPGHGESSRLGDSLAAARGVVEPPR